jgi:hypothetical protein
MDYILYCYIFYDINIVDIEDEFRPDITVERLVLVGHILEVSG